MQTAKRVKSPRKQRKMLYNAPAHLRHKLMAAPLSPQLTASKSVNTLPLRKGDTVRVMRGDNKGFEGKISRVDLRNFRIYLEGLTREKVDGTTIFLPIHPSKVMIKNLNLSDKWRKAIVDRKEELAKTAATAKKPQKKMKKAKQVAGKRSARPVKVEKEARKAPKEKVARKKEKSRILDKPSKTLLKSNGATAKTNARKKLVEGKKKKAMKRVKQKRAKGNVSEENGGGK